MSVLHHRAGHSSTSTVLLLSAMLFLFARTDAARAIPPSPTGGSCSVNTIAYRASEAGFNTTSTTSVVITGMGTSFVQGGTGASCVVVEFSAYGLTTTTNASYIVFELDGVAGSERLFADKVGAGHIGLTTMVAVLPAVAPGSHSLRVRYLSSDGVQVTVTTPTLLVHYRK